MAIEPIESTVEVTVAELADKADEARIAHETVIGMLADQDQVDKKDFTKIGALYDAVAVIRAGRALVEAGSQMIADGKATLEAEGVEW